jgi:hypothetical protein
MNKSTLAAVTVSLIITWAMLECMVQSSSAEEKSPRRNAPARPLIGLAHR